MGPVSSSRSRCKEIAESNATLGFSGQGEAGLAAGPLGKSREINSTKILLSYSSFGSEMATSLPNSTE